MFLLYIYYIRVSRYYTEALLVMVCSESRFSKAIAIKSQKKKFVNLFILLIDIGVPESTQTPVVGILPDFRLASISVI